MRYAFDAQQCQDLALSSRREWILTNGIGGFAMGTVSGANTRRYHGQLVAATQPPAYRQVLVSNLEIEVESHGQGASLSTNFYSGATFPNGYQYLHAFEAALNRVTWTYEAVGTVIERSLEMVPGENTVIARFANRGSRTVSLTVRPLICHKFYHGNFRSDEPYPDELLFRDGETGIVSEGVRLLIGHEGWSREEAAGWYYRFEYPREVERGLDPRDDLFCPGVLNVKLRAGEEQHLTFTDLAIPGSRAETTTEDDPLRAAANPFFVETNTRTSLVAGYPWFTDWGRDTMISLPGLCLTTDRFGYASRILESYASQMRGGLIPNRFTEEGENPEYNTADATLWFVNAIHLTLKASWDEALARRLWPRLLEFFECHMAGTDFGIRVDEDGLLTQGADGCQLTWMDAKLGDWVVTPRRGKAVELCALWVNSCRILALLAGKLGEASEAFVAAAEKGEKAFRERFFLAEEGYYADVMDPLDKALRPNQVLAMSLPFTPCEPEQARQALSMVRQRLLTRQGLRTLDPEHQDYRPRFRGPLSQLDAAYHQGTVWPWLMGPYVRACLRFNEDLCEAKELLAATEAMLSEYGLGGIAEVYDGDEPREPGGCPWQAWSVAEWLYAKSLLDSAAAKTST